MNPQRQPDWDLDLRTGEAAEALALDLITDDTVEVKHDRLAKRTGNLYVETHCRTRGGWLPSGINTTKATVWFFVLDEAEKLMLCIGTDVLRAHVRRFATRVLEEKDGSHPTKGVGVPLAAVTRHLLQGRNAA